MFDIKKALKPPRGPKNYSYQSMPNHDFRGQDLRDYNFEWGVFEYSDFRGANLRGASFKNAWLRGAKFDLPLESLGADFSGAEFNRS